MPEDREARRAIAKEMWERFGVLLAQAPGFLVKEGARGSWAEICAGGGMLLACLGWDGRIARLRLRPDQTRGAKYVFSSSRHGGPGTGAPQAFYGQLRWKRRQPSLVNAPERERPGFVPIQLQLGEEAIPRRKMNVDQARVWMKNELALRFRDED